MLYTSWSWEPHQPHKRTSVFIIEPFWWASNVPLLSCTRYFLESKTDHWKEVSQCHHQLHGWKPYPNEPPHCYLLSRSATNFHHRRCKPPLFRIRRSSYLCLTGTVVCWQQASWTTIESIKNPMRIPRTRLSRNHFVSLEPRKGAHLSQTIARAEVTELCAGSLVSIAPKNRRKSAEHSLTWPYGSYLHVNVRYHTFVQFLVGTIALIIQHDANQQKR